MHAYLYLVCIVLNVRDGMESKFPSIVFSGYIIKTM